MGPAITLVAVAWSGLTEFRVASSAERPQENSRWRVRHRRWLSCKVLAFTPRRACERHMRLPTGGGNLSPYVQNSDPKRISQAPERTGRRPTPLHRASYGPGLFGTKRHSAPVHRDRAKDGPSGEIPKIRLDHAA